MPLCTGTTYDAFASVRPAQVSGYVCLVIQVGRRVGVGRSDDNEEEGGGGDDDDDDDGDADEDGDEGCGRG